MPENRPPNSKRVQDLLATNGHDTDPFENLLYLKVTNPEVADALSEYERLTNQQIALLDKRDQINAELDRIDEEIEEAAAEIRGFLDNR